MSLSVLLQRLNGQVRDEDGATAVEYGLMVALIAVVIIGAVALLGTNLSTHFGTIADCISSPSTCGQPPATT